MSEDEKGFLARWSQRKREAARPELTSEIRSEPKPADAPESTQPEAGGSEAEAPFDLESLPKLEELTAETDMTVFFRKGVPESIRNAALRKSWALDPAIRNYVNPALDYAYDWNAPGGVPGGGELAPGTDVARMVSQVLGGVQPAIPQENKSEHAAARQEGDTSANAAEQTQMQMEAAQSVRLSQATRTSPEPGDARTADRTLSVDQPPDDDRPFAPQQLRRHGSARPK